MIYILQAQLLKNIPDKIQCSKFTINEHDEKMPSDLTLKENFS